MTPYAGGMSADDALDLLAEVVPIVHAQRREKHVEALTMAMDALTWFPLKSAPRDGTEVLLAVAPMPEYGVTGFVCIGRWYVPTAGETLSAQQARRLELAGGWWTAGKANAPFRRGVLGWRPAPTFDFDAAAYGPNRVETVGGMA